MSRNHIIFSDEGFPVFLKDPTSVVDFSLELEDWLDGDAIDTLSVTVPAGITKDSEVIAGTELIVWLSGGTVGTDYVVNYEWTTVGGRGDNRSIVIRVQEL